MTTAVQQFSDAAKSTQVRQFADQQRQMQSEIARMSRAERVSQFGFSSIEDSALPVFDALGQARMLLGRQDDGNFALAYVGGPPPPRPTQPTVSARQLAIYVHWNGRFANGTARPADLARVDIHRSLTPSFTPDGTTIVGTLPKEGGGLLLGADSQTYYVKIVAVSLAKTSEGGDIASAPTDEIAVLPLPATQIAAGAVGAQQLAADIAFISRLIVGDINGAHIELDGRPGQPIPGMHVFNSNLQRTFRIDSTTGDVFIKGQIRTADFGERMVWRELGDANDIRVYPHSGNRWASLYGRTFTLSGVDYAGLLLQSALYAGNRSFVWVTPDHASMYRGSDGGGALKAGVFVNDTQVQLNVDATNFVINQLGAFLNASSDRLFHFGLAGTRLVNSSGRFELDVQGGAWYFDGRNMSSRSFDAGFYMASNEIVAWKPVAGSLITFRASNITTTSARAGKTKIEDLPFDPEQVVTAAPVSMWERRAPGKIRDTPLTRRRRRERGARKDFGPMADDLPELLQVPMTMPDGTETIGIDLGAQIAVAWAVGARHTARLDDHDTALAALTARLDSLEAS